MDRLESNTHSFVIKIWLEDEELASWRGHITHVPSGQRCYFEELDRIAMFIAPYLETMGARFGRSRFKRFLRWCKFGLTGP